MMNKLNIHRLTILILIFCLYLFLPKEEVKAWIPGSLDGKVQAQLPDGQKIPLPGVKLFRMDKWTWPYCGGTKCWGYLDGVEVFSDSGGHYYIGNNIGPPTMISECTTEHGATMCLAGEKGKVPTEYNGNCGSLNWCGYNCGSNPHRTEPYFPQGYHLPGNLEALGYSHENGSWEPPYHEGKWHANNIHYTAHFIFLLNAPPPTSTPIPPPPTSTPIPTVTPTASPTPTFTPTPTTTPTPTHTPTPTPTPPPACYCREMQVSGNVEPGGTVTFTTYAGALTNTEVVDMTYQVCQDCASAEECDASNIIANSGPIPAEYVGPIPPAEQDGRGVDLYRTVWDWTMPEDQGGEICYYIWADIRCAYKDEQANLLKIRSKSVVLAAQTQRLGFFEILVRSIRSFFGLSPKATPTPEKEDSTSLNLLTVPTPTPEFFTFGSTGLSPKLGTFWVLSPTPIKEIEPGCKSAKIKLRYWNAGN